MNNTQIVIHSTGTKAGQGHATLDDLGAARFGFHWLVFENGMMIRALDGSQAGKTPGAVDVAYVGGIDKNGKAADTRTPQQKHALALIAREMRQGYENVTFVTGADAGFEVAKEAEAWLNPKPVVEPAPTPPAAPVAEQPATTPAPAATVTASATPQPPGETK